MTMEPNGNGQLLARLDEHVKFLGITTGRLETIIDKITIRLSEGDKAISELKTEVAVIRVKSGLVALAVGTISSVITNTIAVIIFWKKIIGGG